MKILVSGGTGYVGRFIVEALSGAGNDVIVLGRTPPAPGYFTRTPAFVAGTLDPDIDRAAVFRDVDVFVHASFDHLPGRYRGGEGDDPDGFRRRNLDGSIALFRQARDSGVSLIVFLSSRAVYGSRPPGFEVDEDARPAPDTLYGEVKLAAEEALRDLGGTVTCSLRVTGVYGPAGPGVTDKWTPIIADYLAGRSIDPRAGTEVHGLDVAQAVSIAIRERRDVPPVLNVSDLMVDRHEMLAIAAEVAGVRHDLPARADGGFTMQTERLRALGWKPGGRPLLRSTVEALTRRLVAPQE